MPPDALAHLVAFGAALRDAEVTVGTGQQLAFARAVVAVDANEIDDVYWAGRCTLVSDVADLPTYDRVFAAHFGTGPAAALSVSGTPAATAVAGATPRLPADARGRRSRPTDAGMLASPWEVLRDKDFAACTEAELADIRRLIERTPLRPPLRRSRRSDRGPHGRRPDLRRVLRDSIGDRPRPPRLTWRRPRLVPRPLVLLLDVSGSMTAYSRVLLQFAWSARRGDAPVEVFCFGTRLTRVTGALARRDIDEAIARAAEDVADWDGGTRIGESVHTYLHAYARRAGCRGAVVVLCSDGLERGDPELLAAQLARLRRLSRRVVWVNPLAGGSGYQPTARGMAAALPHIDALVAGHSLAGLENLSRVVSELI